MAALTQLMYDTSSETQTVSKSTDLFFKVALNYYSQWLVNSCGTYPHAVWKYLWDRNGNPVARHFHHMPQLLPRYVPMLTANSGDKLFRPEYFAINKLPYLGVNVKTVAPILRFPNEEVHPGFDVPTRTNGVDMPRWPDNLTVEFVA